MFRVLPDTVLPRAAAVSLLVLTTGLAACGSSSSNDQQAAATSGTTVPQGTPMTKAQQAKAAKIDAENFAKVKKQAETRVAKSIPIVNNAPETAVSIAHASPKKRSKHTVADDMTAAEKALDKAGQKATVVNVTGGAAGAIQIHNTTVVFFTSDKEAATNAQTFTLALAQSPNTGRIARKNNRVYLANSQQPLTASDLAQFKTVRSIVDKAL